MPVFAFGAVEGSVDEAVLRRIMDHTGLAPGTIYGKAGKAHLIGRLSGYLNAARFAPWVILIDLDGDAACAPPFRQSLVPTIPERLCLRIAVRAVEAWLLADSERIARFLRIRIAEVPLDPEGLAEPKRRMVEIAARSRSRAIREDMVARPGSGRMTGPAYPSRLLEFIGDPTNGWRPEVAVARAKSLERALACMRRLERQV